MKRKKILLLSDDFRMTSGIARMSREIMENTLDKYDWAQIGGAINHPDHGKKINIQSDDHFKVPKGSTVTIYPTNGYGNPDQLRLIMDIEKPDAILHFTDPRFWIWLYEMEHEIRTKIPIFYYNIWDDLPDPMYNRDYYRSSDLLMAISKQTYGINKRILKDYGYEDWQIQYVPHGVNTDRLFKVDKMDARLISFQSKYELDKYNFKILYLNRNIRRKNPGDVIMAYKTFCDMLPKSQSEKALLFFHTAAVDEHGTDLRAVHQAICPEYNVIISDDRFDDNQINYIYNSADVYVNLASNEGFGLGSLEALTVGTPIIVNVTGGLQDQCGFKKEDGSYLTADDYVELGSNHRGQYKEHGEWVKPVFPSNISLQGSPPTPYIFDDRCQYEDVAEALKYWYDKEEKDIEKSLDSFYSFRDEFNFTSKEMCNLMSESMDVAFKNWKPKDRYTMEVV
tara:strand:+ start:217 stop:1572 length:1356 start_codon:yes stop_codon:yes gene_type:complete